MALSIILPCYHPPADWEKNVLANYTALCKLITTKIELIIVLDGTADSENMDEPANFLAARIPGLVLISYKENKGKGYATRKGVAAAKGDIILYTDIDFPYRIESILKVYECISTHQADIAIGIKDSAYYKHVPYLRKIISKYLRASVKFLLSLPVTDTQCGLKAFSQTARPLFLATQVDRYLFDLEFIRNAFRDKTYRLQTIEVALNENVQFRKMDYRILIPEFINFLKLM